MSRASSFLPFKGDQEIESFNVYLDHLIVKDMDFNSYFNHRETQPFNEIVLYLGWLAYNSRLIFYHLPERIMRKFDYIQSILKHSIVSIPPAMTRRYINAIFDDYIIYLVSNYPIKPSI